jgi:hypothetical protein
MRHRNDPFLGITYNLEDYSRCESCNEFELNCKYVDDEPYCEGCFDETPCCEACGEHTFCIVEVKYQTTNYSETKEYDHHECLCGDCFETVSNEEDVINLNILKDER